MAVCTILSILDLSPADAAVGEVKDGKFFFSVEEPIKEGTMPTVALASGSDAYPAGFHAGEVGGLSDIDADLAVGNIKKDVVIFGLTGTFVSTLSSEAVSDTESNFGKDSDVAGGRLLVNDIAAGGDRDPFITKADNFGTNSIAIAGCSAAIQAETASCLKLRLFMGGVQMAETGFFSNTSPSHLHTSSSRALSGAQTVKCTIHNYGGGACEMKALATTAIGIRSGVLIVGSVTT